MAHKKAGGSTSLGRDSQAKRLGVKKHAGETVKAGMVLVKQRGSSFRPGQNVKKGNDDTLFAKTAGLVKITTKRIKGFDGKNKLAKFIHIVTA